MEGAARDGRRRTRRVAAGLLAALACAAALVRGGVDRDLLLELPLIAVLATVAITDVERRLIPNRVLAPAAVWALAATALASRPLIEHLAAGGIAFGVLLATVLVYPRGLGMGDVKLAGVIGLYLGAAAAPAILAGFAAGSLAGLGLVARHGRAARGRTLPFAPFLALGGLIGVLFGAGLVDAYVAGLR